MASPSAREPARTLLLYCPFDRRVTRHARRGPDLRLVCLDCGRGADPEPEPTPNDERASGSARERRDSASARSARREEPDLDLAALLAATSQPPEAEEPPPRMRPGRAGRGHLRSRTPQALKAGVERGLRARVQLPVPLVLLGCALLTLAVLNLAESFAGRQRGPEPAPQTAPLRPGPLVGYVTGTDGLGVYLRSRPSLEDRMHAVPEGTALKLLGDERIVEGVAWREIEDPEGVRGWVPAQYLRVEPG